LCIGSIWGSALLLDRKSFNLEELKLGGVNSYSGKVAEDLLTPDVNG